MRFLLSSVLGVGVALALFLLMHTLISGDRNRNRDSDNTVRLDFIQVDQDEIENIRKRTPPPKPEPPKKPPPPPKLKPLEVAAEKEHLVAELPPADATEPAAEEALPADVVLDQALLQDPDVYGTQAQAVDPISEAQAKIDAELAPHRKALKNGSMTLLVELLRQILVAEALGDRGVDRSGRAVTCRGCVAGVARQ